MWKYMVERGRPQMAIWRMRIQCLIPKATNTHSQSVIFIAFSLNNGCKNAPPCYFLLHCLSWLFLSQLPDELWGPPSLLLNGYRGICPQRYSRHSVMLTALLHLVPRLKMCGAIPLLSQYVHIRNFSRNK